MASEYRTYTVQELIDLGMLEIPMDGNHGGIHPKTSDYVAAGVPFIMANDLVQGQVDYKNCAFITEKQAATLKKGFAKPGDVLLTHKATIGRTALVSDEYETIVLTPQVTYYRVKNGISNRYLKYYFDSLPFQQLFSNWAGSGSTRAYLGITAQRKLPIMVPPLDIQRKIADCCGAIDDKIIINNRINDNLQQQARALFYEWFIKTPQECDTHETELGVLPTGFSVIKTGELPMIVTDYVANGSFASLKENVQLYQEQNYAYFIRNTDLKAGTFEVFVDEHSYNFLAKSRLFGGEIIISNVGDVGSVFLCPKLDAPMTLGNNIIMLKPSEDELRYYLYIWFKWSMGQSLIQGIKGGSAQPKFNKTDFKSLPIILPPKDLLHKFHATVRPMFEAIDSNQVENRQLAALRDVILPKLMSGEIDVSSIQF